MVKSISRSTELLEDRQSYKLIKQRNIVIRSEKLKICLGEQY